MEQDVEAPLASVFVWVLAMFRDCAVGHRFTHLQGPPGTGKTYTLACFLVLLLLDPGQDRVGVHALMNSTQDALAMKLDYLTRPGSQLRSRVGRVVSKLAPVSSRTSPFLRATGKELDDVSVALTTTSKMTGEAAHREHRRTRRLVIIVEDESQQQIDGSALAARTHIADEVFTVRVGDARQDLGGRPMGMQQAMVSPKRSQDRLFLRQATPPVPAQLLLVDIAAQVTASGSGDLLRHQIEDAARWFSEMRQSSITEDMAAWKKISQGALTDFCRDYVTTAMGQGEDFHPKNPGDWTQLTARYPPPPPVVDVLLFRALVGTLHHLPELAIRGVNFLTARDFAPPPFPGLTLARNFRGETEDLRFIAATYQSLIHI